MGKEQVTVLSSAQRLPANGVSHATIRLRFSELQDGEIELKLKGLGSFDPHIRRRIISVPVVNGEAHVRVFAPRRPGFGVLIGPGIRHRLEFSAVNFVQGLVFDWLPTLGLSLAIALVLRSYAFATYFIPSGSMLDTLKLGDQFIAEKFSYRVMHQEPERGDIVVFRHPEDKRAPWVKRVIGLPGDEIEIHDFKVYINGEVLEEDYIRQRPWREYGPVTVPADELFVMGDNRNNSVDSRSWGFLPRENLLGRAVFVYWPPSRAHILEREE